MALEGKHMDVEARLRRLERENRRLKGAAIVIAGLVGSMALMGQAATPKVADIIRTKRLEVVDATGKLRMLLSVTKQGTPVLANTAMLSLFDAAEQLRLMLDDSPTVVLSDAQDYSVELGVSRLITEKTGTTTKRSAASLVMFGKGNRVIWEAP